MHARGAMELHYFQKLPRSFVPLLGRSAQQLFGLDVVSRHPRGEVIGAGSIRRALEVEPSQLELRLRVTSLRTVAQAHGEGRAVEAHETARRGFWGLRVRSGLQRLGHVQSLPEMAVAARGGSLPPS